MKLKKKLPLKSLEFNFRFLIVEKNAAERNNIEKDTH